MFKEPTKYIECEPKRLVRREKSLKVLVTVSIGTELASSRVNKELVVTSVSFADQ